MNHKLNQNLIWINISQLIKCIIRVSEEHFFMECLVHTICTKKSRIVHNYPIRDTP